MLAVFTSGFALGGGLIVAIGAQNAFVLRQGLRRERVLLVAALCTACDWALIGAGALGFGAATDAFPALADVMAALGAAFLAAYGALAFRSAVRPGSLRAGDGAPPSSAGAVLTATLAVSLLNPHAILDTVVLTGSVASQHAGAARLAFVAGADAASLAWFFGLAYGARLLAPVFARPAAWRVLDALVGVVMWWIAAGLLLALAR